MVLDLMECGGHSLHGLISYGWPRGPLQSDRLDAATATTYH